MIISNSEPLQTQNLRLETDLLHIVGQKLTFSLSCLLWNCLTSNPEPIATSNFVHVMEDICGANCGVALSVGMLTIFLVLLLGDCCFAFMQSSDAWLIPHTKPIPWHGKTAIFLPKWKRPLIYLRLPQVKGKVPPISCLYRDLSTKTYSFTYLGFIGQRWHCEIMISVSRANARNSGFFPSASNQPK